MKSTTKRIVTGGLAAAYAFTLFAGMPHVLTSANAADANTGTKAFTYFYDNLTATDPNGNEVEYTLAKKFYDVFDELNRSGDLKDPKLRIKRRRNRSESIRRRARRIFNRPSGNFLYRLLQADGFRGAFERQIYRLYRQRTRSERLSRRRLCLRIGGKRGDRGIQRGSEQNRGRRGKIRQRRHLRHG